MERFGEIAGARLHVIEQPDVLDGYDRLLSEGLQQRNLALGEQSGGSPCNRDPTDGIAVTQQRHSHDTSIGRHLCEAQAGIAGLCLHVGDLGNGAMQYRAAGGGVLAWRPRQHPLKDFQSFSAQTVATGEMDELAVEPHHEGELAATQPHRAFSDRVEHRLDVSRRARDDPQNIAGRRLVLERLGQFARTRLHLVEQPHVLDRDHRLVGEGGDQLDLLVGEGLTTVRTQ